MDDEPDAVDGGVAGDAQFLTALARLKARDPTLHNPETRLFDDDGEEDEGGEGQRAAPRVKKAKPVLLKDVVARDALARAAGEASASDSEGGASSPRRDASPTYVEEQAALKRAFLSAAADAEGGEPAAAAPPDTAFGGVLTARRRSGGGPPSVAEAAPHLLDAAFATEADADAAQAQADTFLREYIGRRVWARPDGATSSEDDDGDGDGDDDAAAFDAAADAFEAAYNFRYEEPGGATLVSHPRDVPGVRRPDSRRASARAAREARKAEERARAEAKVRRLKAAARRDVEAKLAAARAAAGLPPPRRGAGAGALDMLVADGDFEPAAHDAAMAAAFGDDFYGEEDDDFDPDVSDDDGAAALAAAGVEVAPPDDDGQFASARARARAKLAEAAAAHRGDDDEGGSDAADRDAAAGGAAAAAAAAAARGALAEYYALDAEDTIGDVKCRFKYRSVPASTYGLATEEILTLPDKDLNAIVGLKRLAPYRDDGGLVRPNVGRMLELGVGTWGRGRRERGATRGGKDGKRRRGDGDRDRPPPPVDREAAAAAARLATYSAPGLNRPGSAAKKAKKAAAAAAAAAAGSALSKAARKNAKRAAKRAAARQAEV